MIADPPVYSGWLTTMRAVSIASCSVVGVYFLDVDDRWTVSAGVDKEGVKFCEFATLSLFN